MARRRRTTTTDPREAWLDAMPDAYQDCRDLGHTWRPHSGGRVPGGGWERVLACLRCQTQRLQTISDVGHVITNRYRYADGYTAPPGIEPVSRDDFRIAAIQRQLGK